MLNNRTNTILLASLFIISLAGCGAGNLDVQTNGTSQLVAISVTPTNPTIAKNTNQQFTAIGTYSDNTTQDLTASVTWSSSDSSVATISTAAGTSADTMTTASSNSGGGHAYAYGKTAGKTTITATSGGTSGSTTLTVTNATLVSLAVTPADPSIAKGTTQRFTATGTFSDSTTQDLTTTVIWSSSNPGVATIGNAAGSQGLAAAVAAGTTTITSTTGGVSGTATLAVTASTTITLAWNAPVTNTDGTPLSDLAGYKIYYGTSSGSYSTKIDIGNVTTYVINSLAPGTYYFTVTTYNSSGYESSYSNEISKTIL